MFAQRSDLALDKDGQGRFLPWLIAFMVLLAIMAMAGVVLLNALVDRWDRGVSGTLTVQIAPADTPLADEQRRQAALLILRASPGIKRADVLPAADIQRLLQPWLGDQAGDGLPLPQLIDVELEDAALVDVRALNQRLQEAVPDILVDDHRVWLDRLVQMFETARMIALGVVALILLATVGTVIFTTKTGLAIHHDAIEVLHLIGAKDGYVAKQFATRALIMGMKGGLLGLVVALPCLYGMGWLAGQLEQGLIPDIQFGPTHWAVLAAMPVLVALVAAFTAQLTVMKALSRML